MVAELGREDGRTRVEEAMDVGSCTSRKLSERAIFPDGEEEMVLVLLSRDPLRAERGTGGPIVTAGCPPNSAGGKGA